MTLRLPEERVRELYERWRRGEVSLRGAARQLQCEPRTVQRRWACWDGSISNAIKMRNDAAREVYWRETRRILDDAERRQTKLRNEGYPSHCGQIHDSIDAGTGSKLVHSS